jgi:hypothetical protein
MAATMAGPEVNQPSVWGWEGSGLVDGMAFAAFVGNPRGYRILLRSRWYGACAVLSTERGKCRFPNHFPSAQSFLYFEKRSMLRSYTNPPSLFLTENFRCTAFNVAPWFHRKISFVCNAGRR